MVRFYNFDIVFAEIPDEVTLAINITGCPYRCPGCHSQHLQTDCGDMLDDSALQALLERYGAGITCVCFMGGDAAPHEIARLSDKVRELRPALRTGWYSGRDTLPEGIDAATFDYVKLGGYMQAYGGLDSPTTNQRMYAVSRDGTMTDVTARFRKQ